MAEWVRGLRAQGIPARVSHHAGTYLCNAALYLSHYFAEQLELPTRAGFIHVPLDVSQVLGGPRDLAAVPLETTVAALRWILSRLDSSAEHDAGASAGHRQ